MGDEAPKQEKSGMHADLRKFLKTVGISSQRKIEETVAAAVESGDLAPGVTIRARMTLELPELGVSHIVEQAISTDTD